MKKILILTGLMAFFNYSFSQTINTVPTTGNVGLGTSSPNTKLQVCGDVKIDSALTVKEDVKAESDLKVDGDVYLAGDLFFTSPITNVTDITKLAVFDVNGQLRGGSPGGLTTYMYQDDCIPFTDINGNVSAYPAPVWQASPGSDYGVLFTGTQCPARVGVGTASPIAELDVNGKIHSKESVGIGTDPNPLVALMIKGFTNVQTGVSTIALIQASGDNGEHFVVKTTGETGISANSSDYALSIDNFNTSTGKGVYVNTLSPEYAVSIVNTNVSGQGLYIESGDGPGSSSNYGLINVVAGGKQIFYVDGKNSITYAREVKVNTNATWPDYVFENHYERMTPEEKEIYFNENKHLPGVPSSAEMQDGIPVSTTLNGLTKNVEENSLDIILLFEEFKKLKEENAELKRELEELKKK